MTKSNKQIYLVYSCDEWKTLSSMRLLLATTSQRKLTSYLTTQIMLGCMSYQDGSVSSEEQIEKFKRDFEREPRQNINNNLCYGYFDYCYDGEEI